MGPGWAGSVIWTWKMRRGASVASTCKWIGVCAESPQLRTSRRKETDRIPDFTSVEVGVGFLDVVDDERVNGHLSRSTKGPYDTIEPPAPAMLISPLK